MARRFTSPDYRKYGIPLAFHLLCWMVTLFFINWNKILFWNAIDPTILQYGLSINNFEVTDLLSYWVFHFSPMHLFYISLIFGLGLRDLDLTDKQQILLITIAILLLPFPTALLIQLSASILKFYSITYMSQSIITTTYIGSSMIAWSYVGASKKYDELVLLGFLFPFFYKLLISHVWDFSPDLAHLIGFGWGMSIRRITSSKINLSH